VKTGIKVSVADADNPATPIKAQVEAGNVTTDVASVEYADAVRLCDEGLLEEIDASILLPAADGSAAADDFIPGAVTDCFVGTDVYSMILAYDETQFPHAKPMGPADFFDNAKYPGQRTMRKGAKFNLELALMADGVAPDQVYETLGTPEGLDRAFARLDTIRNDVIWWEAGAQPPQLLADGEVSMAFAFNGRIFNAAQAEGKPFRIIWDGQIYEMEGWVVPKGAPHLDDAKKFIAFSTAPEQQARAAEFISYGPPRKSAAALVGNIEGTNVPMGPNLPTFADNMKQALASDLDFWVDHDAELQERFNAWLAAN
ncbi:MAG: ABC transporter substrate-binding protein, partial [Paracoccus sp. (in: a-proteobacteria)]